ncbi:unnamed protein product [Chironomus riparius]|uniref:JNK-interacting protein 3 n=1 Tax=Chironomus riparius TaxID=315576 RepID=A0A9P0NGI3_9DIPT|nr:unnamed protein product [Chironomus riparius]
MDNGTRNSMGETVYSSDDASAVMSEKVQSLAGSIYQEFEKMISRYDEDVVKTLMPLLVNVLECLDGAYQQIQEQEVELELLREDNEQLVTQYEREKGGRKQAEQKLLDTEDLAEAENKELASRLESLESIVRMLELKHKNSLEHASRLEEREGELKKEYNKLHDRYTELFKTHVDYMERTKLIMGNSTHSLHQSSASERMDMNRSMRLNPINRSSGPISFGFASLENSVAMLDTETICSGPSSASGSGPPSLQNEIETMEKSSETEKLQQHNQATSPPSEITSPTIPQIVTGRSTTKSEKRSANTLYQELSFQDDTLESEENEITGMVHPGEYASSVNDNFFGMGKEVENLIMENNELLATKNALNIVKDDLIVKVDELTGELEILREELNAVIQSRNKLKTKVGELEDDLRKAKDQIKQQTSEQEDDGDVPMAQRKRFTRVEMARVLMERNQYKERFMELQDAVRWTEMMRATKVDQLDKKSKQSIWKFFSNLFSTNDRPQREPPPMFHRNSPQPGEGRGSQFPAIGPAASASNSLVLTSTESQGSNDGTSERAMARRREQYRQVRAHVQKEDGRLQAYGWSLPGSTAKPGSGSTGGKPNNNVPVPVPVYCRPLAEASPHMKVWCASGVNLNGGYTRDGGCVVGASVFYSRQTTAVITDVTTPTNETAPSELESLDKQMKLAMDQVNEDLQLSSFVWICTSTHSASTVTVIDAKNPADVLDSFPICQTHLLCICTVMGALEMDYHMLENSEVTKSGEMLEKPGDAGDPDEIGKVEYIRVPQQQETKIEENHDVEIEKASEASPDEENIDDEENNQDDMNPTSVGPTMWMGAQNGMIYVHSSVGRWRVCLHAVQLPDAVLSIVHVCGRVVIALANGKVAVFRRQMNGEWDINAYHLITLGSPKQSVRCLTIVGDKVWAAHRNRIHVIDPITLNITHTLEAHPRKESQVRQMAATGLGVWVSIRLDSTLRLYHSQTYEHLQDVDIEPYVSKMLGTGKLGFSFVRITALHVSCGRLWIGTGNGVIISVILTGDGNGKISSSIPKCCMAHSQLSFHGHRDAVKFFVSVPMNPPPNDFPSLLNRHHQDMLVMSGGEGYIDFRLGDGDMENSIVLQPNQTIENRGDKSYLIVWQV